MNARCNAMSTSTVEPAMPCLRPAFRRLQGDPAREYYALVPADVDLSLPPLVLVHGITRNAIEQILRFAPLAARLRVPLIAPLFARRTYGQYQQVIDLKRRIRSDLALFDMLADAADHWGLRVDMVNLFGFSGGSQFAHRLAMLHPARVRACVCAAAGWYSFPDCNIDWPLGLGTHPLADAAFDFAAIRQIPFHVIVGSRDGQRDASLRTDETLDRMQGRTRIERARNWHSAMLRQDMHPHSSLTLLPGTRHNFAKAEQNGLVELVFERLGFDLPEGDPA